MGQKSYFSHQREQVKLKLLQDTSEIKQVQTIINTTVI